MIELPKPDAYQGRMYSTDADDPGWGTWITLSIDEVEHWKKYAHWQGLIFRDRKREIRELYTSDQLRTYGDQRAAEARDLMREECVKICDKISESAWKEWLRECDPHQQGMSLGADACVEAIKELP